MSKSAAQSIVTAGPGWLAHRGTQFFLVVFAATVASFSRFAVNPLQETLRVTSSFTDNQMALLQGPALALPMVLMALPLGFLIDRYSRVALLILFAAVDVVGSLLTAWVSNFPMMFTTRAIVGLAVTAISTTAFSLIADLCPPAQRGRATMLVVIGQYGGMAGAFALGGALLMPAEGVSGDWRHAMVWLTVPMIAALLSGVALREPPRAESVIHNPSTRETLSELFRYRFLITPLVAGLVMAEVATLAGMTWAAPSFARSFGLTPDRIGNIMALVLIVSGVLGPIIGGILADLCQRRGGPRWSITAVGVLTILCAPLGCFAIVPTISFAGTLLTIFMTAISATLVMGIALFTIVVPNELRGLCMALLSAAQVLFGVGLSPLIVSSLATTLGGPATIGTALAAVEIAACVLAALSFSLGRRHFEGTGDAFANLQ